MRKTAIRCIICCLAALVHTGCEVRKDEDYVMIVTEAQSIQRSLIAWKGDVTRESLEEAIKGSSADGVIRWEVSGDPRFLIKSKKPHSLRAGGREKRVWYIDRKSAILRP